MNYTLQKSENQYVQGSVKMISGLQLNIASKVTNEDFFKYCLMFNIYQKYNSLVYIFTHSQVDFTKMMCLKCSNIFSHQVAFYSLH